MNKKQFIDFVNQEQWTFAKTVPTWPHFYLVEEKVNSKTDFNNAKNYIHENCYEGKFYNNTVEYVDIDGWTYWASPLPNSFENQNMINKCKTEHSYESRMKSNNLPEGGFMGSKFSLEPILKDDDFISLINDKKKTEFNVFNVLGTSDYEIRHSNVLAWLMNKKGSHNQGSNFLETFLGMCWEQFSSDYDLPQINIDEYDVIREGQNEKEKIDLLIKSDKNKWIIVIENKIFSAETGDQLSRYKEYIHKKYSEKYHTLYIYLTPNGISPSKESDGEYWKPVSYKVVKESVEDFLKKDLNDRVKSFLEQYLEHLNKNVLKNISTIERQRNLLNRYEEKFFAIKNIINDKNVKEQCTDEQFDMLKSILAVQTDVGQELFEYTKEMMVKHGYKRYSGLDNWITIKPKILDDKLGKTDLIKELKTFPLLFVFRSKPDVYLAEMWIYKKNKIFNKFNREYSKANIGYIDGEKNEEHLLSILFQKQIITTDEMLTMSIDDLKKKVSMYFENELERDVSDYSETVLKVINNINWE